MRSNAEIHDQVAAFLIANSKALRFLFLFVLIFGVCYFFFGLAPGIRLGIIKPFTAFLATAVTAIINLFGASAWAEGTIVRSPGYSINIAMGCDGIEASSLFLAGVLAFPTSRRAKLIGVGFGIPLIQAINLARLVALYYAGVYLPSIVEGLHVYVAQTIVILLSTAILIFWLDRFATEHRRA
jgi:exosortase H (IPTLxxWG-CTERM-specific)